MVCTQVLWDSQVIEACGNERGMLSSIKVQNVKTQQVEDVEVRRPHLSAPHTRARTAVLSGSCALPGFSSTDPCSVPQVSGLFFAIGHEPATKFLADQVALDAEGYVDTAPGSTRTSIEGVFAAGDVQDKKYRQAITAAGTGGPCRTLLELSWQVADVCMRDLQ